jgi:glycosyltransferase involved in cell wall biosynthesis
MKLSVIIPVYNEEKTVKEIIETILDAVTKLSSEVLDYELVIVEDGSKDSTANVLKEHFSNHEKISLYFQEVNKGKGAAITRGFAEMSGDIAIIQDADLEYDPHEYPILLKPILDGHADVVYGSRFKGDTSRVLYFWHYLGNQFLTLVSNMFTNLNLSDMETCYKVFKAPIIKNMILTAKRFGIEPEITAKISKIPEIKIYEVPISYFGRTYAEGKKIGWKDGFSALWSILKFNIFWGQNDSFKIPVNSIIEKLKK